MGRLPAGFGIGILIGFPAAYGGVVLLANGWADCDVGINASANSWTLLFFVLPCLWVVDALLFGLVYAVVSTATWRGRLVGALVAIAALIVLTWVLFAWLGTPVNAPDDASCPGGVPLWWPSWLPV